MSINIIDPRFADMDLLDEQTEFLMRVLRRPTPRKQSLFVRGAIRRQHKRVKTAREVYSHYTSVFTNFTRDLIEDGFNIAWRGDLTPEQLYERDHLLGKVDEAKAELQEREFHFDFRLDILRRLEGPEAGKFFCCYCCCCCFIDY